MTEHKRIEIPGAGWTYAEAEAHDADALLSHTCMIAFLALMAVAYIGGWLLLGMPGRVWWPSSWW